MPLIRLQGLSKALLPASRSLKFGCSERVVVFASHAFAGFLPQSFIEF